MTLLDFVEDCTSVSSSEGDTVTLESGHYWSHHCWNARPPRVAVLFQTPSPSCPGAGFGSA